MKNNKEFLTEEVTRLSLLAKHSQNEEEQDCYRTTIRSLINSASKEISSEFAKELNRIVKTILIRLSEIRG